MRKLFLILLGLSLTMTAVDAQERTAKEVISDMAPGWNLGKSPTSYQRRSIASVVRRLTPIIWPSAFISQKGISL